jgi:kinesin family protein 18/19
MVKISYVEIYNEVLKDLLHNRQDLELREDPIKGVCVTGVMEIMTTNTDEIMKCLRKGNINRTQEATGANEASSRSHAVL